MSTLLIRSFPFLSRENKKSAFRMESTETLSVKVKDILIKDGLVEGFTKISVDKSLRIGFARLLV